MEALAAFQGPPVERLFHLGALRTLAVLRVSAGGVGSAHGGARGRWLCPGSAEAPSRLPGDVAVEGV